LTLRHELSPINVQAAQLSQFYPGASFVGAVAIEHLAARADDIG
jgi:hypothetical protein